MSGEGPKRPEDEARAHHGEQDRDEDREDRAQILARRRMLIASALVGLAASAEGCDELDRRGNPQPCLSFVPRQERDAEVIPREGADAEATPREETDAGAISREGAGAHPTPCLKVRAPEGDPGSPFSAPRACLSMRMRTPAPRPCLEVMRPSQKGGEDDDDVS
jgi:hypothetical protein